MFESAAVRKTEEPQRNLGELLESTLHQAKTLLQAEVSLARSELSSELDAAVGAAGILAAGAMCLQAGLVTLGVLLILAFGVGVASIAVVVALFALGAFAVIYAVRSLQQRKLQRTSARLALDAKQVMETVK